MDAPQPAIEAAGDRVGAVAQRGWTGLQPLLDLQLLHVSGLDVTVGGLVAAAVVLVGAWLLSAFLRRTLARYGQGNLHASQSALYTVSRMVHYVLLVTAAMLALDLAGIPIGKFAVFAGALGVGLGFGLQAIFSNFISGLILLFDRSLKVGDFVELDANTRGTVRAINIRATRITTNDNIDLLVPNAEFVSGRVVNWTLASENRRIRVPFRVAYGVDKELVKKAALEAAERVSFTLAIEGEQRPQVWLTGFDQNSVQFLLVVWLTKEAARRNAAIEAAYLWELDTALKAHGIEIPLPQSDLHIRSLFGLTGVEALAALQGQRVRGTGDRSEQASETLTTRERATLSRNDAGKDVQATPASSALDDADPSRDEDSA